jgi:CRP-like cAMP-binding protein
MVRAVAQLNIRSLHQDILQKVNGHQDPLAQAFGATGWPVHFRRDNEIQGEGETAEYFYQIESGAVRSYKLTDDGRRQIMAFHFAGDVIELDAGRQHRSVPLRLELRHQGRKRTAMCQGPRTPNLRPRS